MFVRKSIDTVLTSGVSVYLYAYCKLLYSLYSVRAILYNFIRP
jgi:hypothetical protein